MRSSSLSCLCSVCSGFASAPAVSGVQCPVCSVRCAVSGVQCPVCHWLCQCSVWTLNASTDSTLAEPVAHRIPIQIRSKTIAPLWGLPQANRWAGGY